MNYIQTLQAKAEALTRQRDELREALEYFYGYLVSSPKFHTPQSDGSRGDWIATGDVCRFIQDTLTRSYE